jgi:uncharacterized protein DUF4926
MMFKELDRIVLAKPVPKESLETGDVGTVVHVYGDQDAFEVEFNTLDGHTVAVVTVAASQVRPVGRPPAAGSVLPHDARLGADSRRDRRDDHAAGAGVELRSYKPGAVDEMEAWFQAEAKAAGVTYLNYATDPRFSDADFADITHMTEAGADKFTDCLAIDLATLGLRRQ